MTSISPVAILSFTAPRPRRFGKSMAANMLAAYYSRGCGSRELFAGLKIASDDSFEKHLNRYDTIFINMQEFLSQGRGVEGMLSLLRKTLLWELLEEYPAVLLPSGFSILLRQSDSGILQENTQLPSDFYL